MKRQVIKQGGWKFGIPVLLLLFVAFGSGGDGAKGQKIDPDPYAPEQTPAKRQAEGAIPANPTFNRDVAPILYKNCVRCHRPDNIAPFPLLTYEDAKKRATLIAHVTEKRLMPPWKPKPGHGEFQEEMRLTPTELAILRQWTEKGMPEGNPSDLPQPPRFKEGWQLGTPDMILKQSKPFTIPAEGRDIYQHFVFPLGLTKERYLKAVEVRPGNRRVVHHAVGLLDKSGTARKLDAKTPEPGYPGMGSSGFLPAGFTPGFVPGQTPRAARKGRAIVIPADSDLVMQIHYHPSGKVETDQTEIGLYFTDEKPTVDGNILILGSKDIDIAPGDSAYRVSDTFKLPVDVTVESIWAHMHLIGKDVQVWAELPNGKEQKMLWIEDWDFNWQDGYLYKKPFRLPKGTIIRAEFTFDNSANNPRNPNNPPQRVLIGEGSTDEMAGLIITVETENGLANLGLLGAVIKHYFEIQKTGERAERIAEQVRRQNQSQLR
jgi:mono/diheme cytochrome c family protein